MPTSLPCGRIPGRLLPVLSLCLFLMASPAEATVTRNPIKVRIAGPPRAAVPGVPFEATLEIESRADVDIVELYIHTGETWRLLSDPLPPSIHLTAGEKRAIPFTLVTDDPTEPFFIEYQFDGDTIRKRVDVSPAAVESRKGRRLVAINDPGVVPALQAAADAEALKPEASTAPEMPDHRDSQPERPESSKDRGAAPASYNVRVVGYFHYRRMNDGAPVGVDGAVARVYDEDSSWDELLATQVLGPDGRLDVTFNWDPCFLCDGTPDIYVEFELDNSEIQVQEGGIFEVDYTWQTGVWNDFGGTFLDIGNQTPSNASEIPACHIMVNAMRAWRFAANTGRDAPPLDIQWPETDPCGACYNPFWEEIYLDNARAWNENTIAHEFGHHFVNSFATFIENNYCVSGFCDPDPPDDCGHCTWCRETTEDAFSEGFADYYSNAVLRSYTQPPVTPMRNLENLARCNVDNQYHDPWQTEGWFAALLVDIDDAAQDNDPVTIGLGKDELNLGHDEIFWIVDFHEPTTPAAFITRFNEEYPQYKEQMWATASNNGYQYDITPPGKVTNITSDHTLNSNSDTRSLIKWFWNRAPDDASGIQGYSIWVQRNILPGMPDATMDVGDVTQFTSGPHPAGWYYISIRALDRNGTWSDTYETAGPFGIRDPDPANLRYETPSNWDYLAVTARHVPDATEFDTNAPSVLYGNGATTYLSAIYKNHGEVATNSPSGQFWSTLFVDGAAVAFHHRITPLGPFEYDYILNKPVTITGGRHVIMAWHDETELLPEPNELDNYWARQWGWEAPYLPLGAPNLFSSPARLYQGTEWIVDGSPIYQNSRGFRVTDEVQNYPNTMWTGITLHATDGADYDLHQHLLNSNPLTAFGTPWASSARGSQATDIFLRNSWQGVGTPVTFDYGITNYSGGNGGFYLQKVTSASLTFPGSTFDILGANEMLKLYQFSNPSGGPVYGRVRVQDPSLGRVYLTLVPQSFNHGPLLSAGTTVVSDPTTGEAVINETTGGYLCLAVWRDPNMGTGLLGVDVSVQSTPPDLAMATPAGWAAPLVPRPANDGAPGAVPAPAFLVGDVAQTWVNYAIVNNGPVAVPPNPTLTASIYVDGALLATDTPPPPDAGATTYRNLSTPYQVRGGRHVLGIHVDSEDQVGEMTNANNTTAGQWVWQPSTPSFDLTQPVPLPPDRFDGWSLMPPNSPLWFNLNGLRSGPSTPDGSGNGWKMAVALLPDAGMDVDLKLFEAAPDAVTGFDTEIASSGWGIDQMDFVIADFRLTTPRSFDAGFLAPAVQPGTGLAEFRLSKYLGVGPAAPDVVQPAGAAAGASGSVRSLGAQSGGTHGPFTIGTGDLFDLYEVDLPIGTYDIRVVPGSGSVDWGIGVYGPGQAFLSRSDALPGGTAWQAAPGAPEILHVTIEEAGLHGVVVWKNRRADVSTSGTFTLQFTRQSSGVPGDPVPGGSYNLISGVRPNPFAGSTGVEVRLPEPADVSLQVFDPSGRRLHFENFGRRETGAHVFHWNGRDDMGEPVPAGIYFVRVTAGHLSDGKKIVRVR